MLSSLFLGGWSGGLTEDRGPEREPTPLFPSGELERKVEVSQQGAAESGLAREGPGSQP